MADESSRLLRDFFKALRRRNKEQEKLLGGRGARRRRAKEDEDRGHPGTAAWLADEAAQDLSDTEGAPAFEHPD